MAYGDYGAFVYLNGKRMEEFEDCNYRGNLTHGLIEDGDFCYPIDFIHYYEKYDIGIPVEYEKYIASKILNALG